MKYLFISGMFRSGTTFLARMLNVHGKIACASDPMRPLFNSYRYDLASEEYRRTHGRFDPLDDYFMRDVPLLKKILESDFENRIGTDSESLTQRVREAAMPYSGRWARSLESMEGVALYSDMLRRYLDIVEESYGRGKETEYVAFKEVWCNEFAAPFLNAFGDDSRVILMLRDPRAVTASNFASGEKYPVLFLARQWRKLAFVSALLKERYSDSILLLRYEDLVSQPEENIRRICNFLDIPYDENMLDITLYRDGDGRAWKKNTHYGNDGNPYRIDSSNIERWRVSLREDVVESLELVCADWMERFGYERVCDDGRIRELESIARVEREEQAEWIRRFDFEGDEENLVEETLVEKMRYFGAFEGMKEDELFRLQIGGGSELR